MSLKYLAPPANVADNSGVKVVLAFALLALLAPSFAQQVPPQTASPAGPTPASQGQPAAPPKPDETVLVTGTFEPIPLEETQRSVMSIDVQQAPLLFSSDVDYLRLWFLPQSEREFLRNFYALEDAFYRREVKPKIDLFNKVVSQEFPLFRAATDEDYAQLLDRLREALPSPISAIAEGKSSKKPVEIQIVDHVESPQKTD